jgi:hypothetical protein
MNFLNNSDKLSSYTSNLKKDNATNSKGFNRNFVYFFISLFTIVIVFSFFIFKKPLTVISDAASNTFSQKLVMAENVTTIKNNSQANLDRIAGVKLMNPKIDHARILAAVIPSKNAEITGNISSTSNANVLVLTNFLVSHGSPMAPYAADFIKYGDLYGVNWRTLVGISGVESGFGRVIPESNSGALSYNAWGWTGGGSEFSGFSGFSSWPNAIQSIARGISSAYGNESPYIMQPAYDPPNPSWAPNVQSYINQL